MNDYERVASIIRYLDEHHADQPDLAALAGRLRLSPFHFHRLFTAWAGVTPKDFVQCLTVAQAKEALKQGEAALGTALDAGLSGPGRLHDLCVTLEGASPGEIKSGGAEWTIRAGFTESPFGDCLLAEGPRGICHLSFHEHAERKAAWAELLTEWPGAIFKRDDKAAQALAKKIFVPHSASGKRPALRACVRASPFQIKVWRALLQVKPGNLVTYGKLAEAAGHPAASRAVGTAVGQNPIAYLIPCHRVIRSTGIIGNYRWGHTRKRALVAWEAALHSK